MLAEVRKARVLHWVRDGADIHLVGEGEEQVRCAVCMIDGTALHASSTGIPGG